MSAAAAAPKTETLTGAAHMNTTPKRKNMLSTVQAYQLHRWAEDQRAAVVALTHEQIAAVATGKLGFHVTEGNISGAERALQKPLGAPRPTRTAPRPPAKAEQSQQLLARCLRSLCLRVGEDFPPELAALAGEDQRPIQATF